MIERKPLNLIERLYFIEIIKAVCLTFSRLIKNFSIYLLNCIGIKTRQKPWVTVEYPDAIHEYYTRFRGCHRLVLKDNGDVKCTACFLCATICPSKCIYIEAQDGTDGGKVNGVLREQISFEKSPKRYEIDTLSCTYCGLCVQACPIDALRMDTGLHAEVYGNTAKRNAYVDKKEILMARSKVMIKNNIAEIQEQHLAVMRELER